MSTTPTPITDRIATKGDWVQAGLARDLERQLTEARVPICIGKPIIGILARDGMWTSANGNSVVAADELFRNNPFDRIADLERQLAEASEERDRLAERVAVLDHKLSETREQRDRLANAITAWDESLDLCECDYGCDGRMPLQGEKCAKCRLWDEVLAALASWKGGAP